MNIRLETSRLILEPLKLEHADALFDLYRDQSVARFLISQARSREAFQALFNHSLAFGQSHGMWAVIPRSHQLPVGRLGFLAFGSESRPELAFLLGSSVWGRGYATEAASAALSYALARHPWTEVVAVVRPGNERAVRTLAKFNFAPEEEIQLNGGPAIVYRASRAHILTACTQLRLLANQTLQLSKPS